MKVRIGIGAGGVLPPEHLGALVDAIETTGFDSLWLSEVLTAPVLDPLVGLAWAAAHNATVKLGTTMLLPGRNPIRLARELAALDALSAGRLLVTLVPGLPHPPERDAIGVPPGRRGADMEEVLPLLRRLWSGEAVTHHGATADFAGVTISPLPVQEPLEVWLGGMARVALERCGRLGDGWLPSLCPPEEAAAGRKVIEDVAAEAGRTISPEHFGVSVGYSDGPLDDRVAKALAARSRGRSPIGLVPTSPADLRTLLERYVEAGMSKFVLRPLAPPASWPAELERLAAVVGDLQTT